MRPDFTSLTVILIVDTQFSIAVSISDIHRTFSLHLQLRLQGQNLQQFEILTFSLSIAISNVLMDVCQLVNELYCGWQCNNDPLCRHGNSRKKIEHADGDSLLDLFISTFLILSKAELYSSKRICLTHNPLTAWPPFWGMKRDRLSLPIYLLLHRI